MGDPQVKETVKVVRSPSYPVMPLRDAIAAVGKIEAQYRSAPVDRVAAAKLIGFKSLSGPANQALAALASYGLVERAGKGEMRVTLRAKAILHPNSIEEKASNLRAAALGPKLYQELRERFAGVPVPPEGGVISYLHRQGFNQSAIRPAVKAFLSTITFLEDAGVSESHGPALDGDSKSGEAVDKDRPTFGGAQLGDLVQWESQGVLRLEKPKRVRWISEDRNWLAVSDSTTGIPMTEVIVQERAGITPPAPLPPEVPPLPSPPPKEEPPSAGTDLRFKLGKGLVVKVSSPEELGADELDKLVILLQAQSAALKN